MFLLSSAIHSYAWVRATTCPWFLGREPSGEPQAELWIGAHDADPSHLPDGRALNAAIAAEPDEMGGERLLTLFRPACRS